MKGLILGDIETCAPNFRFVLRPLGRLLQDYMIQRMTFQAVPSGKEQKKKKTWPESE